MQNFDISFLGGNEIIWSRLLRGMWSEASRFHSTWFPQVTFLSQNCHNSSKIAILLLGFLSALQHQAASTRSGSIQITLSINFSSFHNAITFFENSKMLPTFFKGHLSPKNFHQFCLKKSPSLSRFQITLSIAFANNTTVAQTFDCVTRRVVNKK